ncbi:MAG: hypothetical protein PUG67_09260 [Peptoniphilaceae bacterium]|nr:hypothetical protein [Peptoniphilaceae bacterium]MDY6018489.1 hypothetical protein [Anaerococcus sp.]
MKLNKKVLAGALALAMGLGVVVPAANSYAADSTSALFKEEYTNAGQAWLKAYNEKARVEKVKKGLEDEVEAAKKAANEVALKVLSAEKTLKDATAVLDELIGLEETDPNKKAALDSKIAAQEKVVNDAQKAKEAADKELADAQKTQKEKEDNLTVKKYSYYNFDEKKSVEDTLAKALEHLTAKEEALKDDFKAKGADKALMELMKETNNVVLPKEEEKPADKADVRAEIEKLLATNKKKLSAVEAIKEYMPESYKKYKKVIDEAVKVAKAAIEKAEKYLNGPKTASLFTVSYAAEEEKSEAEDVLNSLKESEKKLDDAMSQVEADNKEQNEKEAEEKKEEEKPAKTESADQNKNKPVVSKQEDKKPAKNVKTGVAGVAGVGAVLAAASAAYVSSKRK